MARQQQSRAGRLLRPLDDTARKTAAASPPEGQPPEQLRTRHAEVDVGVRPRPPQLELEPQGPARRGFQHERPREAGGGTWPRPAPRAAPPASLPRTAAAAAASLANAACSTDLSLLQYQPLRPNAVFRPLQRGMFIQTQNTPNPNAMMFLPGQDVMGEGGGTAVFSDIREATASPLARSLFQIDGVIMVFYGTDYISVTSERSSQAMLVFLAFLHAFS